MKLWKCGVCGFIHEGEEAPEKCPKCGAPREAFRLLEEREADLVLKSRTTNDIHMALNGLLEEAMVLAEEGLEINLDPGCAAIFQEVLQFAKVTRQKIKAELETHMQKGKWG